MLSLGGLGAMDQIPMGNIGYSVLSDADRARIRTAQTEAAEVGADGYGAGEAAEDRRCCGCRQLPRREGAAAVAMGLRPPRYDSDAALTRRSPRGPTPRGRAQIQRRWRGYTTRCARLAALGSATLAKKPLRLTFYRVCNLREDREDDADLLVRVETGLLTPGARLAFAPSGAVRRGGPLRGDAARGAEAEPPDASRPGAARGAAPSGVERRGGRRHRRGRRCGVALHVHPDGRDGRRRRRRAADGSPVLAQLCVARGSIAVGRGVGRLAPGEDGVRGRGRRLPSGPLAAGGAWALRALRRRAAHGGASLVPCREAVFERYAGATLGLLSVGDADAGGRLSERRLARRDPVGGLRAEGTVIDVQKALDPLPAWALPFEGNRTAAPKRKEQEARAMVANAAAAAGARPRRHGVQHGPGRPRRGGRPASAGVPDGTGWRGRARAPGTADRRPASSRQRASSRGCASRGSRRSTWSRWGSETS